MDWKRLLADRLHRKAAPTRQPAIQRKETRIFACNQSNTFRAQMVPVSGKMVALSAALQSGVQKKRAIQNGRPFALGKVPFAANVDSSPHPSPGLSADCPPFLPQTGCSGNFKSLLWQCHAMFFSMIAVRSAVLQQWQKRQ